jgi:hypothetical protein
MYDGVCSVTLIQMRATAQYDDRNVGSGKGTYDKLAAVADHARLRKMWDIAVRVTLGRRQGVCEVSKSAA